MKTSHIPGPWIAQHRMRQDGKGGTQRWHILAGSDRSIEICNLPGWDEDDKANAYLLAAAPDLLNALELAETTILRLAKTDSANGTLDVIRAAIAKAEGRQ